MSAPDDARRAHVQAEAARLDVLIQWRKSGRGGHSLAGSNGTEAWAGYVSVPSAMDVEGYVVALHELGHTAHLHLRDAQTPRTVIWSQEVEAWAWAVAHAQLPAIEDRRVAYRAIKMSLASYARRYRFPESHADRGARTVAASWIREARA